MVDVKFVNEKVEEYIRLKLDKDRLEDKDLLIVKKFSCNNIDFDGNCKNINLDKISRFKNLEILVLKNFVLDKKILKEFNKFDKLKVIYFKNVTFNSRFKFKKILNKVYFDDCVNFENIKFKKLNCVEVLNSYINNNVLKRFVKVYDVRINNCKMSEHLRYNIISKVKVFYLNNVSLETNIFLEKFKTAEVINLNGTNIIGKVDIKNMKNDENYYKVRE